VGKIIDKLVISEFDEPLNKWRATGKDINVFK